MKKNFIFTCCLFIALFAKTQDHGIFSCENYDECIKSANILLEGAKRQYQLTDTFTYNNKFVIEFEEANPQAERSEKVKMIFLPLKIGANPAMEIEGITIYELEKISGLYLDIVPIWQKYVDPDVDIEALSTRKSVTKKDFQLEIGGENFFIKQEQNKRYWLIERWRWLKKTNI